MKIKKEYLFVFVVMVVLATTSFALAKPNNNPRAFELPAKAVEVAPGVFYLGEAFDNGRKVQGYAMFVKPTCNNNGICEPELGENPSCADCKGNGEDPDSSSCYGFLSREAKWKTIESYIVDPTNIRGLNEIFVTSNLAVDIGKWETAAGVDILGNESLGDVDGADTESPDGKNEVYFADVVYENAIAITIIWGIFRGPPQNRELVEWDQVYDDVDFDWSANGEAGKMDFENIATHELGHSVGLDDLYTSECSEQTMYGYADYGETKKRSLEDGDKTGVTQLYN